MTTVNIYVKKDDSYAGFILEGHSGYAESGADIVCAGLSALAINTVNSIEVIAGQTPTEYQDEESGTLKIDFPWEANYETELFMRSFEMGIMKIADAYPKYVKLNIVKK